MSVIDFLPVNVKLILMYSIHQIFFPCAFQEVLARGKKLKVAHFQLDNTSRENKNKWVVSFSQLMVHLGFAEEIRLSFLPVGYVKCH